MSKLYEHQSPYQNIQVWESESRDGSTVRALYLDDDLQFDDNNELAVHEAFLEPLVRYTDLDNKQVLILGGGDGGMARTTLNWFPHAKITQCEIDEKVIEVSKEYFPKLNNDGKVFEDISLHIGDGQQYVYNLIEDNKQDKWSRDIRYDTTILDLTIHPQFDFKSIATISDHVSFFISYKTIEQFDLNTFSLFEDYRAEPVNIKGYHNDSIIFCAGKFK